jgi:hypothetical protein
MKLSPAAQKELIELAQSASFREDMETLAVRWRRPFLKDGEVDVDAYIEFVTAFNEFISHEPKPFNAMVERDMRL